MDVTREQALMRQLAALGEQGARPRFVAGLRLPLWAVRVFMGYPKLLLWAIVPAMINMVLFALAVFGAVRTGNGLLTSLWARPELTGWISWFWVGIWWLLFGVVIVVGVVLSYFFVLMIGGLISGPFHDELSTRVEKIFTGEVAGNESSWFRGMLAGLFETLRTLGLYLLVMALLFGMNLVPVVGSVVYTVLAPVVSMFFLVLEYTGGVLDRHGFRFGEKARVLLSHRSFSAGYGVGASVLAFVPILNLVAMPILVVAGTIAGLGLNAWSPIENSAEGGVQQVRAS